MRDLEGRLWIKNTVIIVFVVIAGFLTVFLVGSLLSPAPWSNMPMGPMMMGGQWPWAGYGFPNLLAVLVFALFIAIIFIGAYYLLSGEVALPRLGGDRALGILRERYARGEITRKDFKEMAEELKKSK